MTTEALAPAPAPDALSIVLQTLGAWHGSSDAERFYTNEILRYILEHHLHVLDPDIVDARAYIDYLLSAVLEPHPRTVLWLLQTRPVVVDADDNVDAHRYAGLVMRLVQTADSGSTDLYDLAATSMRALLSNARTSEDERLALAVQWVNAVSGRVLAHPTPMVSYPTTTETDLLCSLPQIFEAADQGKRLLDHYATEMLLGGCLQAFHALVVRKPSSPITYAFVAEDVELGPDCDDDTFWPPVDSAEETEETLDASAKRDDDDSSS